MHPNDTCLLDIHGVEEKIKLQNDAHRTNAPALDNFEATQVREKRN
jgi:hypothetical protein